MQMHQPGNMPAGWRVLPPPVPHRQQSFVTAHVSTCERSELRALEIVAFVLCCAGPRRRWSRRHAPPPRLPWMATSSLSFCAHDSACPTNFDAVPSGGRS